MDNCSIHHISEIVQMIEEVGAIVHFLPRHPPDLIIAFSKVKTSLKLDGIEEMADMEITLLETFATTTPYDCQGWIAQSGLYF